MLTDITLNKWLELNNYSPRTKKEYRLYYNKLALVGTITQEKINDFITQHNNNVCRSFLKSLIKYLTEEGIDNITPEQFDTLVKIRIKKLTSKNRQKRDKLIINKEELAKLEMAFKSEQGKIMLLISYHCALRCSELFTITKDSFNWKAWEEDTSKYGLLSLIDTKNGDIANIPIPPFLMERIKGLILGISIKDMNFNFTDHNLFNLIGWTINSESTGEDKLRYIKQNYKTWEAALKENSQNTIGKSITSHCLRRSFATNMLNAGLDIRYVQEHLRHKDIGNTQLYTTISKENLTKKLEEINKI